MKIHPCNRQLPRTCIIALSRNALFPLSRTRRKYPCCPQPFTGMIDARTNQPLRWASRISPTGPPNHQDGLAPEEIVSRSCSVGIYRRSFSSTKQSKGNDKMCSRSSSGRYGAARRESSRVVGDILCLSICASWCNSILVLTAVIDEGNTVLLYLRADPSEQILDS